MKEPWNNSLFSHFFLFISYKLPTFVLEKKSRTDWIGKLIKFYEIPRQASVLNGGPRLLLGVTFESVDYKEDEHSKPVFRSFITSSVRLSYKSRGEIMNFPSLFLLFFCLPLYFQICRLFRSQSEKPVAGNDARAPCPDACKWLLCTISNRTTY